MATITNVADLVLWDANYRVLRLADGTADVNPKRAEAKSFRIRWSVSDRKDACQILIGVDRTGVARSAYRELLEAMAAGTEIGADGWPVTGRRPATGRVRQHAVLPAPAAAVRTAAPGAHPHATMTLLEYFDQVLCPLKTGTVQGNTLNQFRSAVVAVNRCLVRDTAAGPVAITVASATTAELVKAITDAAATGGASRAKKLYGACSQIFMAASTDGVTPGSRTGWLWDHATAVASKSMGLR